MIPYPSTPVFFGYKCKCKKGDKGDRGDRGDKGDKGKKGERGAEGVAGDRGPCGPPGERGPPGVIRHNFTQYIVKIIEIEGEVAVVSWAHSIITDPLYTINDISITKVDDLDYIVNIHSFRLIKSSLIVVDQGGLNPLVEYNYDGTLTNLPITVSEPLGTRIYLTITWES